MSVTHGNPGLKLQVGSRIIETKEGLTTGSAIWTAPNERAYSLAPVIGSAHPYVTFITMERREIVFGLGLATIVGEFAGMDPKKENDSDPVYELQIGAGDEPIETHPDFVSKIGGKPSAPLNGAVFIDPGTGDVTTDDNLGVFEKFKIAHSGGKNPFAGIEAYLDSSEIIWRKKYTSRNRPPSLSGVTTIQSPDGPNPGLSSGRNWLYMGLSYTQRGNVFSVSQEWKGSGRAGWNRTIYS